jgi:ABC-type multidrug transport system fused ATPase/permease subunit
MILRMFQEPRPPYLPQRTSTSWVWDAMGGGVQFTITVLGRFIYMFWASWQASLVMLVVLPLMSLSTAALTKVTQSQPTAKNENYANASRIVYSTASFIKTVLSLNACRDMIHMFENSIDKAYEAATSRVVLLDLCNGSMMGALLMSYVMLKLHLSFLLYSVVRYMGCDPSGGVGGNTTCTVSCVDIFGALTVISFGVMGLPQVVVSLEVITNIRSAVFTALCVMKRHGNGSTDKNGQGGNYALKEMPVFTGDNKMDGNTKSKINKRKSVLFTNYAIYSSFSDGIKPDLKGIIQFKNITFAYPS